MAKRKKLNTRVVVLLAVFGVLIVAFAAAAVIRYMPKDPVAFYERGMEAFDRGEYRQGARDLGEAIHHAGRQDAEKPEYYYHLARLQWEWAEEDPELTRAEQRQFRGEAHSHLETALRVDSAYMPARRFICDIYWYQALGRGPGEHWDRFIRQISRLIEVEPSNDYALYQRGVAKSYQAAVRGEYREEAMRDFRKAIELNPEEADYWLGALNLLTERGDMVEAENIFSEALEATPDSAQLRLAYAEFLSEQGRPEEAMAQIREAMEHEPESAEPFLNLATHYRREGDHEAAYVALQNAMQADPTEWRVDRALAGHYERQGQVDDAVGQLREGIRKVAAELGRLPAEDKPMDRRMVAEHRLRNARIEMNQGAALLLVRQAQTAEDSQQAEEFISEAEQHMEVLRELGPDTPMEAEVSGRIAMVRGDTAEAMRLLQKAYEHYGARRPRLALELMELYLRRGAPGRAEEILERLLATPGLSNNPMLLTRKATIAMHYRQYDEAERILRSVVRANPDFDQARDLLAAVETLSSPEAAVLPEGVEPDERMIAVLRQQAATLWMQGSRPEAVQALEQLHERVPEHWGVTSQLVNMYMRLDRRDDARRLLAEAGERHPEKTEVDFALRMLQETDSEKRYELAMEAATVEEDPARRELAKAGVAAVFGREQQYVEHLRSAMEIDPDSPEVVARMFGYALSQEDWELAEECADAAERLNLDQIDGRLFRAQIAAAQDDYDRAIELLAEVLPGRPDLKRARAMLASYYSEVGKLREARETFRELWSIDPMYAPAAIGMARVTEQLGEFDEHQRWIERAHDLAPNNAYVRSRYLALQEERGTTAEVIAQRERVFQDNPGDTGNAYRLAVLYEREGRMEDAERMYTRVAENLESRIDAAGIMASFYLRTGREQRVDAIMQRLREVEEDKVGVYALYGSLVENIDPSSAERAYSQAVETDPEDPRGYWAMSNLYAQRQRWEDAVEYGRKCVELRPENIRYRKGLISYLINAGEHDEATERLNSYLAEYPEDVEAITFQAVLALREGEIEQARSLLDEAIARGPDNAQALRYRAQLRVAEGRLDEAAEDLQQASRIAQTPDVSLQLADLQVRMEDHRAAERTLRELLSEFPGHTQALQHLMAIYQQDRRWDEFEELLRDVRERFPEDPRYLVREAEMWAARDSSSNEIAAMEKAVELAPQSAEVLARYMQSMLRGEQYARVVEVAEEKVGGESPVWLLAIKGRALAGLDRQDESEEVFVEALRSADTARLPAVSSHLLAAYGPDESVSALKRWQETLPDSPHVQILLAQLHQAGGDHARAIDVLGDAQEIASDDRDRAEVYKLLGLSYHSTDRIEDAEQAYREALDANPDDPLVMNNLAYLYTDVLGKPEEALPYAEQAARMMPNNAAVLDTYGWTLFKLDRIAEAERQLLRAIQLDQPSATVRYHLGAIYEHEGRRRDALRQYRQGYELIRDDHDHDLHDELEQAVDRIERELSG